MSYEVLTSTPVIIAALVAWVLGVVGTRAWQRFSEWRFARMIGESISEVRRMDRLRLVTIAHVRHAESAVSEKLTPSAFSESTESNVGDLDARCQVPVESVGPTMDEDGSRPGCGDGRGPVETAASSVENQAKSGKASEPSPAFEQGNVRLLVGAKQQVADFLAFECARHRDQSGGLDLRRSGCQWVNAYLQWADIHSIGPMPGNIFLQLLGRSPGISKERVRIKDDFGRVIKNRSGSPLREIVYALVEESSAKRASPKRETRAERLAREAEALAERRRVSAQIPDRTWAEEMHAIRREENGRRKAA